MKLLFIVITFITFVLFFIEALIHFTIGKIGGINKEPKSHKYINVFNGLTIHIPDKTEFVHIFITVLFFSIISGLISTYVIKHHLDD